VIRWPIASGYLLLLMSCSINQYSSMAQAAADEFHRRLEAKEDDRIFTEATPAFRKAISAETSRGYFARIRRKLGMPRFSQLTNIQVNHTPSGTLIAARFRTTFDRGDAEEIFTWSVQDGSPRLAEYFINSALLLTD